MPENIHALAPETLSEWDDDAVTWSDSWSLPFSLAGIRIRTLIRALTAEKAAREEAVRKFEQQVEFRREYERMAEKAEQERDAYRARIKEMDDDVTLLNALQDAEEDRDAAEREVAQVASRAWNAAAREAGLMAWDDLHEDDRRAITSPTDPTKEGE